MTLRVLRSCLVCRAVVPADQGLAADDLAGVEVVLGLQVEHKLAAAHALKDLGHEDLLVAAGGRGGAAADLAGGGEARVLGQALEKLGDLLELFLLAVSDLVTHGRDDVFMELFREKAQVAAQHVPGDAVDDVEHERQDHAGDGGVECNLNTAQQRLHARQGDVDRAEADAADTDEQADEGAQNAETGQGAGDLEHDVLPGAQGEDVLVDIVLDIRQGLAGFALHLDLLPVVAEQSVQRALVEEILDLGHDGPGGACLYLQRPLYIVQSRFKGAVIRHHRQYAEYHARQHDAFHDDDEHRGNVVRGV